MQMRLQDFPRLNIKNYQDAKILFDHIKLSLKFEFSSPIRFILKDCHVIF